MTDRGTRKSWVLLRWHKAGLIGVYRLAPDAEATDELAAREAYLTVERFERWRPGEPETHLFATERGATAPDNVWLSVLGDD